MSLEDLEWLRRLAARLVRDPHTAEDAVQDTLVSALESGPWRTGSWRGWLARVLRNTLRQEWRGRSRRAAREAVWAAPAGEPEPHRVVAELALHRRLADEVERLSEPYRTAVLLRFLREREVASIARELGVPEKTVRSRVERGLAELRARLGRDREAWLACLAFTRPSAPPLTLVPWLFTMNLKLVSAAAGLSVLGVWLVVRAGSESSDAWRAASLPPAEVPRAEEADPPVNPAAREAVARAHEAPSELGTPPAETVELLHGSVRTLDGAGVALTVVFRPDDETEPSLRTRSEGGGRFELPLPRASGRLGVEDELYATVTAPYLTGSAPLEDAIVVVAPGVDFAGLVRGSDGTPLEGAGVSLTLAGSIVQSRDVGGSAVHLLLPFVETRTDTLGNFRCTRVGYVEGIELVVSAEGFETKRTPLAARSDERLEVVLTPSASGRTLRGRVLQASGAPAAGALVSLGSNTVPCAADGSFALEAESWRDNAWVRAVAPGVQPAELRLPDLARASREPILLTLGRPALALAGRVVDAAGEPVPFAEVFTGDTTPFGRVEYEENGRAIAGDTTLEAYLVGLRGPGHQHVAARADGAGRFELRGLLPRPYALFALDPRTLAAGGPLEAEPERGTVELRITSEALVPVAGRVSSRSGQPLEGVSLTLARTLEWEPDMAVRTDRWAGCLLMPPNASWALPASTATTDAEGRFTLGALAVSGAYLILRGPALALGAVHELAPSDTLDALEITVEAATRFQIVLRHPAEADAFELRDTREEASVLFLEVDGLTITAVRPTIEAGRSGTILAREGEYTLTLFQGDREVRRVPLTLEAGGLFELEF